MQLRAIFYSLVVLLILLLTGFAWWVMHPSSLYLQPVAYSVQRVGSQWQATWARDLPRGDQLVDWHIVFIALTPDHTFLCSRSGSDLYRADRPQPIAYSVSPWADECLDSGPPVNVQITRSVRVFFGLINLRPVVSEMPVLTAGALPPRIPADPPPALVAPLAD